MVGSDDTASLAPAGFSNTCAASASLPSILKFKPPLFKTWLIKSHATQSLGPAPDPHLRPVIVYIAYFLLKIRKTEASDILNVLRNRLLIGSRGILSNLLATGGDHEP